MTSPAPCSTWWETEGYGVDFAWPEYERLAQLLRSMQGKAVVSINDHPRIRTLFEGLQAVSLQLRYSIGTGDSRGKAAGELIIKNWDDSQASLL